MADKTLEQRFEELEKRVRVYEDIEEIKQLTHRYQDAYILEDMAIVKDCFTEDAVYEITGGMGVTVRGRENIVAPHEDKKTEEMKKQARENFEVGIAVQPRITVDGDQATGNWTNYNLMALRTNNQPTMLFHANYDCEYVRQNGVWKIKYLKVLLHRVPVIPE